MRAHASAHTRMHAEMQVQTGTRARAHSRTPSAHVQATLLGWTVVDTRTQRLVFVLSRAGVRARV